METAKRIIFLLILAVLVTSPIQSEEKQSAQISGTRAASCLVKITCDPAILPLNFETVDYLFHSSGVGGKAARDILNISPDQLYDLFTIESVQLGVSDGLGGYGLPPSPSRAGRSGVDEYGSEMLEYDEMMMDATMMGYSDSPKSRGSSSAVRSASRSQPGTGKSSSSTSRRSTTSPKTSVD